MQPVSDCGRSVYSGTCEGRARCAPDVGALHRRSFLESICRVAPGFAATSLLPGAALAQQPIAKDLLLVRSARPEDLETPVHLLDSWITPNELFFVRSHFYTPMIDASSW